MSANAFVGWMIAVTTVQWLAIDIYLPAMPLIRDNFGVTEAQLNLTLSLYVIATAVGMILIGPLSDKYGRKRPVLVGMALFIVFNLCSAFSFNFSIIAGAAMSVQGVMNTRLQDGMGLWEANAYVQGTAFLLSIFVAWIFGSGSFKAILEVPKGYWLGGVLGLIITVTVMLSIKGLNPTVAISTILIAQLLVAALIEAMGWMGQDKLPMGFKQFAGLALMLGGVVLFKLR